MSEKWKISLEVAPAGTPHRWIFWQILVGGGGKNRRRVGNLAPKSANFDTFYPKLCKFLQFSPKFAQILTFFPKICANFDNFYPKFCKFWQFLPKKGGKLFQRIFACWKKIKFCGRIFTYGPPYTWKKLVSRFDFKLFGA